MAPTNSQRILAELQKYPNLDPKAVLAIAAHEGLGGGIGDNGTSFGPWQLHQGGAYPSYAPQAAQAAQQWAWSPQGIDYALSRIQSVAGGLTGLPAIEAISTRFERPANPQAEIQDAANHYGLPASAVAGFQGAPGPGTSPAMSPPAISQHQQQSQQAARMLAAAVNNANQTVGLPAMHFGSLLARAAGGK